MTAEELIATGIPSLMVLIGQAQMSHPERDIPIVLDRVRTIADREQQERLLTTLMSLVTDQEILTMIEQMIVEDESLDTPFIRRLRLIHEERVQEGLKTGLQEGLKEGRKTGLQEGLKEGRKTGMKEGRKEERLLIFKQLMTQRFGDVPAHIISTIGTLSTQECHHLLQAMFEAKSLDDIVRLLPKKKRQTGKKRKGDD